jgi:hypothetical protein
MRPIIQALEFHISAVLVNPRNGAWNFGSTFGNSTWEKKEEKKKNNHFYAQGIKKEVTKKNLQKQEKERAKSNSAHTPGGSFAA